MTANLKKYLVHILAYVVLLLVSFIYFSPVVFEGKVLQQSDNIMALGMQEEMREYKDPETGHFPLWTNSMFSGMPTYQILYATDNPLKPVFRGFLLGNHMLPPHTGFLLLMFGLYFLLVVLKIDWRIALFMAVAFGFGANFMDQIAAGHSTKIVSMAYMGPILASVILCFRGKYLTGGVLTAFFLSMQLLANHLQITYYTLIMIGILGAVYLVRQIQAKDLKKFLIPTAVVALAAAMAFGTNTGRLWTTYEYSKESIRGESDLTEKPDDSYGTKAGESGLSKSYVFNWSYGKLETFTFLIPNFMGGSSNEVFVSDRDSETFKALTRMNNPEEANQYVRATSHYWGNQPSAGSTTYYGAIIMLLFFIGAFLVKNPLKIWLLIGSGLFIMMAWGSNFAGFNNFLYDYLPMYNSFRAVTMVLGPAFFLVCIMAALGLQNLISGETASAEKLKALKYGGAITGGLMLVGFLLASMTSYNTASLPSDLAMALQKDRAALLRADALRSLLFAGAAFGLLWFYVKGNFKGLIAVLGIGILIALDMFGVARRTLNSDDFVTAGQSESITQPTEADKQIMADPDIYYRVADFRRGPFADAITSYHHKSIGGYHAAKLMRYQEAIEKYLGNPSAGQQVYDMLNTKYFIAPGDQAQQNPGAMGNAWFVPTFEVVEDEDAEYQGLASLNPAAKALIRKDFAESLQGYQIQPDSNASIQLMSYHPDTLVYRYSAAGPQLAVFSEVYYPADKGWETYLDGEPYDDILKANFLLRALPLPAGQNRELKMVFSPDSYYTGEKISFTSGLIIGLAVLAMLFFFFRNQQGVIPDPDQLPQDAAPKTSRKATSGTQSKRSSRKKKK
ncbi:MAG: hypothetical protein GYB31_14725 [Bacteroidetes bacterium]|nr:hypothetical protein [Bacteroidota bacterium]